MDIKVVIGANYGDEGKGQLTDFFTHRAKENGHKVLNILHNGGAQRAHTVVTPEGIRHVFRHVGSGSLAGADTFLADDFLINPIELRLEIEKLRALGCTPMIYISGKCQITTPFDSMFNQILEEVRDGDKVGSCGMGIWETTLRGRYAFSRDKRTKYSLTMNQLQYILNNVNSDQVLTEKLKNIKSYFVERRFSKFQKRSPSKEWKDIFNEDLIIKRFIEDLKWISNCSQISVIKVVDLRRYGYRLFDYDTIIFENGQGLLLDGKMIEGELNNTPSNTDLTNIEKYLIETFNYHSPRIKMKPIQSVEFCYVSRTYLTRHGIGVFPDECKKDLETDVVIDDPTNVYNMHQGGLRFAPLNNIAMLNRCETTTFQTWASIYNKIHNAERLKAYYYSKGNLFENVFKIHSIAYTHTNEVAINLNDVTEQMSEAAFPQLYDMSTKIYTFNTPTRIIENEIIVRENRNAGILI